jgi:hypothetical protein
MRYVLATYQFCVEEIKMNKKVKTVVFVAMAISVGRLSKADTGDNLPPNVTSDTVKSGEIQVDHVPSASSDTQNVRMKTLEGSTSRFSGQFNLTYSGSSISNPFSGDAPNPGNQVPRPLVTLSGTVSARYRIDEKTTIGLGTGLTTQTPFQGPKNTAVADPYADIARSYKLGPFQNRADFQATFWTNNQYSSQYGYRFGLTASNEIYYLFNFGLTVGLVLQVDYNIFASGAQYDSSQQTEYDFFGAPYFEFKLSRRFNLRSVIGNSFLHNRDLTGALSFYRPEIYQTFGVGISIVDAVFVYPFVQFFPFSGNVTSQTSLIGFNTIINLF